MNKIIKEYIETYPPSIQELFFGIRKIIYNSTKKQIEEKMYAKLPSYYVTDFYVRLIPFRDHINIETSSLKVNKYKECLSLYKITPKGMLQIYLGQTLNTNLFKTLFNDVFENID